MEPHTLRHPEMLVSGDWLAAHHHDPALRVFDATIQLRDRRRWQRGRPTCSEPCRRSAG